jgi:hypothetical protein
VNLIHPRKGERTARARASAYATAAERPGQEDTAARGKRKFSSVRAKKVADPWHRHRQKIEDILSPGISTRIKGSNVTVKAKLRWELGFGIMSAIELDEYKAKFINSKAKVNLEEHFYSIILEAYKQDLFMSEKPGEGKETEKNKEPGLTFTKQGELSVFKTELKGKELGFKLAEIKITGDYVINKDTFQAQSANVKAWLASYAEIIEAGKMSLKAGLEISVSVDLKPSDYLEKSRKKRRPKRPGRNTKRKGKNTKRRPKN